MNENDLSKRSVEAIGGLINTTITLAEINLMTLNALGNSSARNHIIDGLRQVIDITVKKINDIEESIDDSFRFQSEKMIDGSAYVRDSLAELKRIVDSEDLKQVYQKTAEGHDTFVKRLGKIESNAINEISEYLAPFRKELQKLLDKVDSLPRYR